MPRRDPADPDAVELLKLVIFLKGLNEVLLFTLLGQALLWLLAGSSRESNFVYNGFRTVTTPLFRLFRRVTPAFVADRHIPAVAMSWLLLLELVLAMAKIYLVISPAAAS